MADDTKPETAGPKVVPQTGEATAAVSAVRSPVAGQTASAPPTGANPKATPHATTTPAARPAPAPGAAATAAAAPTATAVAAGAGAHAARPAAAPRPAPAPIPDLAGKTTSIASAGGAAAARTATAPAPAAAKAATRDPDDTSPLLTRRAWLGLAWGAFSAASAAALAATGRFMFPNVLNEPPQQFKAGFPTEYGIGVDERWKEKFGVWLVRTTEDIDNHISGFYSLSVTCTHLGCTPNYLSAENKFKCPCHGSGFRLTGVNFEGPAPRPLERVRIVLAEDGQILIDKSRHFQRELGQWTDPEAFLKA
ncbi:MAG TPA: ubiquinol-cytochrome c reductase iron-sulfur subunit [Vicinamibacterales bacterium]|nr:ubiquinol-cytochrome c reductase iron-sulfur subunit [Vicinamibacterales bacterium]